MKTPRDVLAALVISVVVGMAFHAATTTAGTILTSNKTEASITQTGDINTRVSSGTVNAGQTGVWQMSFTSGTVNTGQTGVWQTSFSSGTSNAGQTGVWQMSFSSGNATVTESQTTTVVHSSGLAATTNLVALSALSTRKTFTIQNQGTNAIFVAYDAGTSTPPATGVSVSANSSLTENRYTGAVTVETSAGTSKFVVIDVQ